MGGDAFESIKVPVCQTRKMQGERRFGCWKFFQGKGETAGIGVLWALVSPGAREEAGKTQPQQRGVRPTLVFHNTGTYIVLR